MPTPDGRQWLTSEQVADRIIAHLDLEMNGATVMFPLSSVDRELLEAAITTGYRLTGYDMEFKLVRLFEKFKDKVGDGTIGNMEQVRSVLADIYNKDILDLLDEDGEESPP